MSHFRPVTDYFAVSGQLSPIDVAAARAEGFTLIIDNRPDGEAPGQATAGEIAAAAEQEGLAFRHIPVVGLPLPGSEESAAVSEAIAESGGKTLAYCRTGTRSIALWALGELAAGQKSRDELLRIAADAGYDLAGVLPH